MMINQILSPLISPRWHTLIAAMLVWLSSLTAIRGGDLLWHLKIGDWMLTHHRLFTHDIFSHTFYGAPTALHSSAFQILVAATERLGSWPWLVYLKATLALAIWCLVRQIFLQSQPNRPRFAAWAAVLCVWLASPQMTLHPQLFFYLFTLSLFYLNGLSQIAPIRSTFLAWGILMLWPWMHPSFMIGYLFLGIFAASHALSSERRWRRLALFELGSVILAATITYLLSAQLFSNVFTHLHSRAMLDTVHYWQPTWKAFVGDGYTVWIFAHLIFVIAGVILSLRQIPWLQIVRSRHLDPTSLKTLLAFGICLQGVWVLRFYPLIPLLAAPLVWPKIRQTIDRFISPNQQTPMFIGLNLLAVIAITTQPHFQWRQQLDRRRLPAAGVEFLRQNPQPQQIFNSYNFGGYLIYTFDDSRRVFIDPRSVQLYPDSFQQEFSDAYHDSRLFEKLVSQYQVGHTFIQTHSAITAPLLDYLNQSHQWQKVYADEVVTIHARGHSD